MKLCPFKFGYYEFEGGQDCIGSECGMFKRCNADDEITAVEFDALDEHAQELERESAELKAKLDQMTVERDILQDCVDDLNADTNELQAKVDELTERNCPGYEPENHYCRYHAQDFELNHTTVSKFKRENAELRKQVDKLTEDYKASSNGLEILTLKNAELQTQVNELKKANDEYREEWHRVCQERTELANELGECMAERDLLREKLGSVLDAAHELERIGQL